MIMIIMAILMIIVSAILVIQTTRGAAGTASVRRRVVLPPDWQAALRESYRWNRNPRPQPQRSSKLVFLMQSI